MKLPNFSATFYCLTIFLLGLKGEIRNNVLAAVRLLATSTPVSQWRGILQIFGYKCLGEGDEQTGGFFGGNMGNVEIHQARISDGVLNFPLLDWIKLWMGDINSFTLANCRYSYSCIVKTKNSKGILHYWCKVFVKNFFHFLITFFILIIISDTASAVCV